MRPVPLAFVLLCCLAAAAPAASALGISLAQPAAPIRPGLDSALVQATLTDDCQDLLVRSGAGQVSRTVEVQIEHRADPGVLVAGIAVVGFDGSQCAATPTGTLSLTSNFTLSLASDQLALVARHVNFTASLPAAPGAAAASASALATVYAAAQPIMSVEADITLMRVGVTPVQVHIHAVNLGNIAVTADVQTTSTGNYTAPGTVALTPLQLAGPGQEGASADATLTFTPPTGSWETQTVSDAITPVAGDPAGTRGATQHVTFLFQNDASKQKSGAAGPELLLVFLAAAVVQARRAKRTA